MRSIWFICLPLLIALPAAQAGIFDDPENLKVLAEDTAPDVLRATMRGFSLGTGFRCEGCHVGEGNNLDEFDFASDEKDTKETARVMLQMVNDLNARLERELGAASGELVQVRCVTCHRGQEKPRMLEDVLVARTREEGVEAAVRHYRELRERYYGAHTYDFGEMTLVTAAQTLAAGDADAAMEFLDLNLEFNPASVMTLIGQGQLLARQGDTAAARARLEQALAIDPDNGFVRQMLSRLQ